MSDAISVVLIDDSDDIRDLIGLALRRDDRFDIVAEAVDGQQGLDAIATHRPDLVLLDLAMPVKDGLEVIEALKSQDHAPIVIVLSGFSSGPPESAAVEAGAAGYIEKGLSLKEMGDRVHELYAAARAKV